MVLIEGLKVLWEKKEALKKSSPSFADGYRKFEEAYSRYLKMVEGLDRKGLRGRGYRKRGKYGSF